MQKKSTLFILLLFVSSVSIAQFKKGTVSVNFNIGDIREIGIRNNPIDKRNYLSFNPGAGYFITKNWEAGVGLNYRSFMLDDSSHRRSAEFVRIIGFNVYSNYYFGNGKLKPYLTMQAGYYDVKSEYWDGPFPQKSHECFFYFSAGAGVNWNISDRFSLFAEASYIKNSCHNQYNPDGSTVTVGARLSLGGKRNKNIIRR